MAISAEQRTHFSERSRKIAKTAYIRFNVAERLISSERLSTAFSAMLTIYLICSSITLFSDAGFSSTTSGRAVSFIGIISSIALLVINLMDGAMGRPLMADLMHRNAQQILKLSSSIDLELQSCDPSFDRLSDYVASYHDVLNAAGRNHDSWDNDYYESINSRDSSRWLPWLFSWSWRQKLHLQRLFCGGWFHIVISITSLFGFFYLHNMDFRFLARFSNRERVGGDSFALRSWI